MVICVQTADEVTADAVRVIEVPASEPDKEMSAPGSADEVTADAVIVTEVPAKESKEEKPWSINSFALSKVWFKCSSVDLRVGDITAISSSIKSWLYANLFEKPSEGVMCRPISYGPKFRALACLIRSFLKTAVSPN